MQKQNCKILLKTKTKIKNATETMQWKHILKSTKKSWRYRKSYKKRYNLTKTKKINKKTKEGAVPVYKNKKLK